MADRVLVSSVIEAVTAHLRALHPDWVVEQHSAVERILRVWSSAEDAEASRFSSATVSVEDDRPRYSSTPSPHAIGVEVKACGDLRRVTYKALADLPALCAKIGARLAEGFTEEVKAREVRAEKARREERVIARKDARTVAHPLAFAAGCRHDSWQTSEVTIPSRLADVALAAVEAHLRQEAAQKEAAPPPEGEGAACGAEGAGC